MYSKHCVNRKKSWILIYKLFSRFMICMKFYLHKDDSILWGIPLIYFFMSICFVPFILFIVEIVWSHIFWMSRYSRSPSPWEEKSRSGSRSRSRSPPGSYSRPKERSRSRSRSRSRGRFVGPSALLYLRIFFLIVVSKHLNYSTKYLLMGTRHTRQMRRNHIVSSSLVFFYQHPLRWSLGLCPWV